MDRESQIAESFVIHWFSYYSRVTHPCGSANHDRNLCSHSERTTSTVVVMHCTASEGAHYGIWPTIQHPWTVIMERATISMKEGNGVTRASAVGNPT